MADRDSGSLSVIDSRTNSVTKTVSIGNGASAIAVNPIFLSLYTKLYAINMFGDTLSVVVIY